MTLKIYKSKQTTHARVSKQGKVFIAGKLTKHPVFKNDTLPKATTLNTFASHLKNNIVVKEIAKKYHTSITQLFSTQCEYNQSLPYEAAYSDMREKFYIQFWKFDALEPKTQESVIVHELVHRAMQLSEGDKYDMNKYDDLDYIDSPRQQEAFKFEIKFFKEEGVSKDNALLYLNGTKPTKKFFKYTKSLIEKIYEDKGEY